MENYERLKQVQENHEVIEAEETLKEAYETDVRKILREVRKEKGLPEDTIKYVKECEKLKEIVKKRG